MLVPNPGYPTYSSASLLAEAGIVLYDLKEETGWMPDVEQLENRDLSRVKMMWTNYPNAYRSKSYDGIIRKVGRVWLETPDFDL